MTEVAVLGRAALGVRALMLVGVMTLAWGGTGCVKKRPLPPGEAITQAQRKDAIRRASVWAATDVASFDFKADPAAAGAFKRDEWVSCSYKKKQFTGNSPKFECEASPGDSFKVKYGARNGEVFSEVLSTRLFTALGFAADRMYAVRVRCSGCPDDPWRTTLVTRESVEFDPAVIERKIPGRAMETYVESGWKFSELDDIGPNAPADARAQRDALKLLSTFVQHTDSQASNQRLLCPKGQEEGKLGCKAPVMMVQDLGQTFGSAHLLNLAKSAVKLPQWRAVPVWKDAKHCVAELSRSFTGTLHDPVISEAGRAFLAGLLVQLSDAQIADMFEAARVETRLPANPHADAPKGPPVPGIEEWVAAFKLKRLQIVDHHCPA